MYGEKARTLEVFLAKSLQSIDNVKKSIEIAYERRNVFSEFVQVMNVG